VTVSGIYDFATLEVVTAFQRHFRPALLDGIADVSTVTTLKDLLTARATDSPLTSCRQQRPSPSMPRQSAGRLRSQSPKGREGGKSGLHRPTVPDNVRRG